MTAHFLNDSFVHHTWDNSLKPRLTIKPGDMVTMDCREASDGHIRPDRPIEEMLGPRETKGHPLTGPIYIEGAEPGDSIAVEILKFQHKGWGWTRCIPVGGLLPGEFTDYITLWDLKEDFSDFKPGIRIPLEPFCGCMGVAPADPGPHDTTPPRISGGNMDIRHLVAGSTLFLPVYVNGALFSAGDCHAAQGDGEVCITGIEAPMQVTLRFQLRKGHTIPAPQFITPSPLTKADTKGYFATTGIKPDLMEAAKQSIRYMIDHLVRTYNLTREESYHLCSVVVDLKISEIVDSPNWIVSAYLPLSIFNEVGSE